MKNSETHWSPQQRTPQDSGRSMQRADHTNETKKKNKKKWDESEETVTHFSAALYRCVAHVSFVHAHSYLSRLDGNRGTCAYTNLTRHHRIEMENNADETLFYNKMK